MRTKYLNMRRSLWADTTVNVQSNCFNIIYFSQWFHFSISIARSHFIRFDRIFHNSFSCWLFANADTINWTERRRGREQPTQKKTKSLLNVNFEEYIMENLTAKTQEENFNQLPPLFLCCISLLWAKIVSIQLFKQFHSKANSLNERAKLNRFRERQCKYNENTQLNSIESSSSGGGGRRRNNQHQFVQKSIRGFDRSN